MIMSIDLTVDTAENRQSIIDACLEMNASGLNQGTSGNISLLTDTGMLITPTSVPYKEMHVDDIVLMPTDGKYGHYIGRKKPSSEWRFHLDTYLNRDDIGSMVHTHSLYATTLSILRKEIPACHYMIAAFGGPTIRCADYAIFGCEELSKNILSAMQDRYGCLLSSHGMVTCGRDLKQAMWRAVELETLANQYYLALQAGDPFIMSDEHIAEVGDRMASGYGVWEAQ